MKLPEPLDRWFEQAMAVPLHDEPRADCGDCVMCRPTDWSAEVPGAAFLPDTRCCTYVPTLWNFQVGAVFAESDRVDPRGVQTVRDRLQNSDTAYPVGLMASMAQRAHYDKLTRKGLFGQDRSLRCPHYLEPEGHCGVHAFRNGICSTWFCRHERGMLGKGFWVAIRELLQGMEQVAAVHCVAKLRGNRTLEDWEGIDDREAFYKDCWALARELDFDDLREAGSDQLQARVMVTQRAVKAYSKGFPVPEAPTMDENIVTVGKQDGDTLVITYSRTDPIAVPPRVLWELPSFDGRPLDAVRAELAEEDVEIDDSLMQRLLDWRLLR